MSVNAIRGIAAHERRIQLLTVIIYGELRGAHIYEGRCPEPASPDDRDPHCPQCRFLVQAGFGAIEECGPDCECLRRARGGS